MSNKMYDNLKLVAQVILPALATFIVALGEIWGIPLTTQISATIMAVDTLLGAILTKASKDYSEQTFEDQNLDEEE